MRLSLSNRFFAVSHDQFRNYCADFQAAVEHVMLSPFSARVVAYSMPKEYITIVDEALNDMCEERNAQTRLFDSLPPKEVSKEMWDAAKHIEVILKPLDDAPAPDYAFAYMDFKGHLSRTVTFYAQGKDAGLAQLRSLMCERYPRQIVSDGFADHGNSNTLLKGAIKSNPMQALGFVMRGFGPSR